MKKNREKTWPQFGRLAGEELRPSEVLVALLLRWPLPPEVRVRRRERMKEEQWPLYLLLNVDFYFFYFFIFYNFFYSYSYNVVNYPSDSNMRLPSSLCSTDLKH